VLAHHREPNGSTIPTDEIAHHLLLLAWAGYDTTASAASWVLHMLAQRPDWQQRIRAEIVRAGDDFAAIESSKDYPQLDWFLLEVERMYPSALIFPRIALEDIALHGVVVPAGSVVFYCPYMSGRDPGSFEHPNAFDPERWNPERGAARPSPSKLFGFGGGPRVCLGKAFARLQLKLMVQTLLTRFRVEPDPLHRWSVMGVPVHHPVDFHIRLEPLH
jgi:cytochrome P450